VQFQDDAGKAAALKLSKTSLDGALISVLPSKFAVAEPSPKVVERAVPLVPMSVDPESEQRGATKGSTHPPSGQHAIKSQGAFKPRGLGIKQTAKVPNAPAKKLALGAIAHTQPSDGEGANVSMDVTAHEAAMSNADFRKFYS
jgi:hypothetical protein